MKRGLMQDNPKKIRVLVVDDSAVMRKLISNLLARDKSIEVIATAIDGDFAINKVDQLKPDVVTLDVDMPRMDGMTALKHLVSNHQIPVVMLSSLTTHGAALTMEALEIGAVDFVYKPKSYLNVGEMAEELILKVKAAARGVIPVKPRQRDLRQPRIQRKRVFGANEKCAQKIIAIGSSSGGPNALRYMLPKIPADIDAGILIVQHMMDSFTASFAKWLNEICELEVKEAINGDLILPGRVLIAPGNAHMKVTRLENGGVVLLERGRLVNGHMPSVDVLFKSVAEEYGANVTGVLMTGMGSDGANGLGEIKQAGGFTIAQDRESCVVYGMPRVAVEKGFVDFVAPLKEMASHLITTIGQRGHREEVYVGNRR
ncbi:MAG: chemotaxis response regulator protein-glutamate methylesterase [Acidobacteriota bacterium]